MSRAVSPRMPRDVVGLDNLNAYYIGAQQARLDELAKGRRFVSSGSTRRPYRHGGAVRRASLLPVVHLAAQAGVRHSLVDPHAYAEANLTGFLNILEGCRQAKSAHLVYARHRRSTAPIRICRFRPRRM